MMLTTGQRRQLFWIFCAYTLFVVYGSLVPLQWRDHTLDQALQVFAKIPWLDLGAVSRADWVANIVLYLPMAFLASALWIGEWRRGLPLLRTAFVLAFCLALAVAVEFAQIFFAPRTVSLNDLVAETLGSLTGIALWLFAHKPAIGLWQDYRAGGRRSLRGATAGFALAYLGLALFPFDFVISGAELAEKWQAGNIGLLLAGHDGLLRTGARLGAETVAIMPLGILLALLARNISLPRTFIIGAALGLILELIQLFLFSGVSQGISVLARATGLTAGAALGLWIQSHGLAAPARWIRRLAPFALLGYLPALFALAGWATHSYLGLMAGLARIPDIVWLPFYFHYYSTEPVALASLLANLALYAPLGLLAWAWQIRRPFELRAGAMQPAFWALGLASMVEGSKLFLDGSHPDPTNLLIAACGAALAYAMSSWLERVTSQPTQGSSEALSTPPPTPASEESPAPQDLPQNERVAPWRWLIVLPALVLLGVGLVTHPLTLAAIISVLGASLWLWHYPNHWLLVLVATLPVLNLAPWSGRQLLDLFDLIALVSIAHAYARLPLALPRHGRAGLTLLLISTVIALLPGLDHLNVDASHGGFEAWLVGKGLIWGLLLVPPLLGIPTQQRWPLLLRGLALGLGLLSLWVVWERQAYVGLWDFDNVFRVTGGFAQMYSGGAYIEAFITLAFPALLWHLRTEERTPVRLLALMFACLAAYAMLVTFSRGGYLGLALAALIYGLLTWKSHHKGRWLPIAAAGLIAAASIPVMLSGFAQQRLSQIGQDFDTRWQLWQGALSMLDSRGWLVGMGFGQYPSQYLLNSANDQPPGTWQIMRDEPAPYLRLFAGEPYYLDQVLKSPPKNQALRLLVGIRLNGGANTPQIRLCRKALLYSFGCYQIPLPQGRPALNQRWQQMQVNIPANAIPPDPRGSWALLKLSLAGPTTGTVDIGRIDLQVADSGLSLLENSNFSHALDHWMPAIDFDPPWHIHQAALDILFAQGLLGLAAFTLLILASVRQYLRRNAPTPAARHALFAGVVGVLAVGLTGSIADEARVLLLILIALSASLAWEAKVTPTA